MKETNLSGKDYGFTNPWNKAVDITKPNSNEKIKQLGEEAKKIRETRDTFDLSDLSDEQIDRMWLETQVLLRSIEAEAKRRGLD